MWVFEEWKSFKKELHYAKFSMQLKCYFMQIFDLSSSKGKKEIKSEKNNFQFNFSMGRKLKSIKNINFYKNSNLSLPIENILSLPQFVLLPLFYSHHRWQKCERKKKIKSSKLTWKIILEMSPGMSHIHVYE